MAIENPSVDAFSPRVALNFKTMDDLSFRASWGMSFRAPTLYERFIRSAGPYTGNPNPALDKKTMTAYEIGMFKQFGDKLSFDIAGFLNDYNNLIESVILSNTPLRLFQFRNITKARIWGIETSLNYRPTSEWTLNAAFIVKKKTSWIVINSQKLCLEFRGYPKYIQAASCNIGFNFLSPCSAINSSNHSANCKS